MANRRYRELVLLPPQAAVERELDRLERECPELAVVRMRPGLMFKAQAATEIRRLFGGPLVPRTLIRPEAIPFLPDVAGLVFQVVHSLDVGHAYRLALLSDARGAFNLAAEPSISTTELAEVLRARPVRIPAGALRAVAAGSYALHLQPSEPGWLDMALAVPLMDTARARSELGWEPRHGALETLRELINAMRAGGEEATPPLAGQSSGPGRARELLTGLGHRP